MTDLQNAALFRCVDRGLVSIVSAVSGAGLLRSSRVKSASAHEQLHRTDYTVSGADFRIYDRHLQYCCFRFARFAGRLCLRAWQDTVTLAHVDEIVGKVRLALTPKINHWWNVALYVSGAPSRLRHSTAIAFLKLS